MVTSAFCGFAALGAISVARKSFAMLSSFNRHFLRSKPDFYQKYAGTDSWAVVTGGSDGIGFEICGQMAARGFNICIIARDD